VSFDTTFTWDKHPKWIVIGGDTTGFERDSLGVALVDSTQVISDIKTIKTGRPASATEIMAFLNSFTTETVRAYEDGVAAAYADSVATALSDSIKAANASQF